MKSIQDIAKELHKINFGPKGIICTQFNSNGDYTYADWKANGKDAHKYTDINNCCCNLCDCYNDCVLSDEYKDENNKYQFTNVSHGTHMLDFLKAHGADISKIDGWSTKPVMFVMENPSNGKNNRYVELSELEDKCIKRPSKSWYWLNSSYDEQDKDFIYPNFFTQGEYGRLVYSIMNTFKIANGYLTNMVKCGIGYYNADGTDIYTTTDQYNESIVEKCIENKFYLELRALRRKEDEKVIIFAFSERTYVGLKKFVKDNNVAIYLLPHPASRLANDYRKYVLFAKIMRELLQNSFYTAEGEFVPLKPNFEQIIASDSYKADEESSLSTVKENLKNFSYEGILVKKKKSYENNAIGYELLFTTTDSDEISSISFRYYNEKTIDKDDNKVSWVNYSFIDNSFSLFVGKGKTANKKIKENFDKYFVFNAMNEFLKTKLKIDISTMANRQEDH